MKLVIFRRGLGYAIGNSFVLYMNDQEMYVPCKLSQVDKKATKYGLLFYKSNQCLNQMIVIRNILYLNYL